MLGKGKRELRDEKNLEMKKLEQGRMKQ